MAGRDIRARLAAPPDAGPLARRSHRLRAALTPCLGSAPSDLAAVERPPPSLPFPRLRATAGERAAVVEAAREVLDGLISWEIERLEGHLAPIATMLWADGSSGAYDTAALLPALERRGGRAAPLLPKDFRTYLPGEWRAVLPRSHAALLAAFNGDRTALAVTAALDGKGGGAGRALLYAAPGEDERWRILGGPLPSPDDVVVKSAPASADEDEALRVADRAVRRWHLGQRDQLEAMRNDVAERIRLWGAWLEPAAWAEQAAAVDPDGASWLVFGGTRVVSEPDLARDERRALEREAKGAWRRSWAVARARFTATKVGAWDPDRQEVVGTKEVRAVVLRYVDEDARGERRERWRLGGMWP